MKSRSRFPSILYKGDLDSHWRVPERAHAKERLKFMCPRHGALKGTLCDTCLFLYPLPPLRKDDASASSFLGPGGRWGAHGLMGRSPEGTFAHVELMLA